MEKSKPEAPPPRVQDPAPIDDLRVARSPVRCPFCHEDIAIAGEDWVACSGCLARHHQGCWAEGGRCGSCGGVEPMVRESSVASERPEEDSGSASWLAYVAFAQAAMYACAALASVGIMGPLALALLFGWPLLNLIMIVAMVVRRRDPRRGLIVAGPALNLGFALTVFAFYTLFDGRFGAQVLVAMTSAVWVSLSIGLGLWWRKVFSSPPPKRTPPRLFKNL